MQAHTKPKISGLIHAMNEILSSTIHEKYKPKLIDQIFKDLKSAGYHAEIIGKQNLVRYYQEEIDTIIDNESVFECISEPSQTRIDELTQIISTLNDDIEYLGSRQAPWKTNDVADQNLKEVIGDNCSVEGARFLTIRQNHKAIELYPFLENSIVLTKKDLNKLHMAINQSFECDNLKDEKTCSID